jgi:hypothetical protein
MRSASYLVLGAFAAASLFAASPEAVAQGKKASGPAYQVVRLAFPGAAERSTWAYDLNDRKSVVGEYNDSSGISHGFHYERTTNTYRSLGIGTRAQGINELDEIVGFDEVEQVGLFWPSPSAEPVPLLPLPGHTHSRAARLNNAGIVIGSSFIPEDAPVTPGFHAAAAWYVDPQGVVWGPVELPYLAGDLAGEPTDLTEAVGDEALVIGTSETADSALPVSWAVTVGDGGLAVIGPATFDGDYAGASPWTVNNSGDAVGVAAFAEGAPGRPFLRRADQAVAPLPLLSNAFSGSATGINDAGVAVGGLFVTSRRGAVERRAVLWSSTTTVVDLNSLVSLGKSETLVWSLRVNNSRDILAIINGHTPCLLIAK